MNETTTDRRRTIGDVYRDRLTVQVRRMNDGARPFGWIIWQAQGSASDFAVAKGSGRYRSMEEALRAGRGAMFKLMNP